MTSDTNREPRANGSTDWRLLIHPPATGPRNMAVDEALLESVKAGAPPTLRLYRWDPPCLSLGRNQPARDRYDTAEAARRGVDIVRRPTGGMAVYHDRELTYAAVAPIAVLGRPRAAYRAINRALVAGLRRLGIDAALAGTAAATPKRLATSPCFDTPAAGEVVADGRKLVGSAQRCDGRTILQHGSILISGSQEIVSSLGDTSQAPARPGWVTLQELAPEAPAFDTLADAIRGGLQDTLGVRVTPDTLTDAEEHRAAELLHRHASDDWVWRR